MPPSVSTKAIFQPEFRRLKGDDFLREVSFDRATLSEEKRTIGFSFSSEMEVLQWRGYETLEHTAEAVDLARLKSKRGSVRDTHNGDQIGVVESAELDAVGRKLRGSVRFSKNARAEEIWNDVKDGIRNGVSIRYTVERVQPMGEREGIPVYRVIRWKPIHVSFEPDPADDSVGPGRSLNHNDESKAFENMRILRDPDPPANAGGAGTPAPAAVVADPAATRSSGAGTTVEITKAEEAGAERERTRITEIQAIASKQRARYPEVDEAAAKAIKEGWSIDKMRKFVLEDLWKAEPVRTPEIGMSQKEVRRFSLLKACREMAHPRNPGLTGLEKESCEEAAKQMRRTPSDTRAFIIPEEVSRFQDEMIWRQQRAQNVTTATAGGFTVSIQQMPLIEFLRNRTVLGRMGITILDGLVGDLTFPVQTGGATAYWVSETGSITDSEATFGQKAMTPHRLGASVPFTMQFLAQTSLSADAFLRNEMDTVLALKKDLAGLLGTGVAGEPLGVANTTGINATVTYSGAADWGDIVEHETGINVDNADIGTMGFIIDAATTGKWKTKLKDSVAGADYLINSMTQTINGYRWERTQQIVSTHQSFFGVWSQLLLGQWAGREVTVDNITLAKQGQHLIIMNEFCDFLVRQPLAFNVSTDTAAA